MKISIVVPAYNEEKLLPATLHTIANSAAAFTETGWDWEIIVCDNNSTDDTARIARQAGANVVFEPVNQISRARNTGAQAASGDWLIFIDADTLPSHRLFMRTRQIVQAQRHLAAGANIRFDSDVIWAQAFTLLWNTVSRLFHLAAGSFVAVDAATFRKVGGFSTELYASEEVELSIRLNRVAAERGLEALKVITDPLIDTSGRKMDLYSGWEYFRFLGKGFFNGFGLLQSAEHCHLWYDGRR